MQLNPSDLVELAKYLGVGGALALLIMFVALWRGAFWTGPSVDRLIVQSKELLDEKDKQIAERDRRIAAQAEAIEDRQRALDRTLELATVLKTFVHPGSHGR